MKNKTFFEYILRQADNALILGQRLSEWCGHGPVLEEDIALTNIALDKIGEARALLSYAGEIEGKGRGEDDLAFHRDVLEFRNVLLVEQENGNFADTIARQFFYDQFCLLHYTELLQKKDEQLKAIAAKSLKEISYHRKHSAEWVIRLGDGTDESQLKMQNAIDNLWRFTGELFEMNEVDSELISQGIAVDLSEIKNRWNVEVNNVLEQATLKIPPDQYMVTGGKKGLHSENFGFILAEMQFLPRAYPDAKW